MRTSPCGSPASSRPRSFGAAVVVEAFVGLGQQPPAAVERIVFAASMAERLVLHPAAALIELVVRELHDMERVGDLDGVGQHRVEHRPIRARQIQRRPRDVRPPRRRCVRRATGTAPTLLRPGTTSSSCPARDVDDRRRPPLTVPRPDPHEQRLVQPERGRLTDPVRIVIDERGAVGDHRVVDRVPVTARARPATSFTVRPCRPTWTVTHRPARSVIANRGAAIAAHPRRPRPDRARRVRARTSDACATPAGPDDRTPADRPARPRPVLDHHRARRSRAHDGRALARLDMHPQRHRRPVDRRRARSPRADQPAARTCA